MKWRESSCCARVTEEDVLCFRERIVQVRQVERPFCCGNAIIVHFPRNSPAFPTEFQAGWHVPTMAPTTTPTTAPTPVSTLAPHTGSYNGSSRVPWATLRSSVQWTTPAQRRLQARRPVYSGTRQDPARTVEKPWCKAVLRSVSVRWQ